MRARVAAWLQELLGITALRAELAAARRDAEWHYSEVVRGHNEQTDLLNVSASQSAAREAYLEQTVDRLEVLVTPVAPRLRSRGAPRSDWDAIQVDHLSQLDAAGAQT